MAPLAERRWVAGELLQGCPRQGCVEDEFACEGREAELIEQAEQTIQLDCSLGRMEAPGLC